MNSDQPGGIAPTTCYNCGEDLIFNEPCQNPNCKVHGAYAKSSGSEVTTRDLGSDSDRKRVEEDRCPHCGRRQGDGEVHIRNKQGGDSLTVAYVSGVGVISVKGTMSIHGEKLGITPQSHVDVVSHRRG